ncbi:endoribonuclease [Devosia soli]|uniref:Endoribonuclease n=1 Tax=Devosia soli TaxID=361041 RepID=A0A0F5LER1_9HYPH|nr:RidA family protein [Devosia soli]KKB80848.1 endoribonuclease [Devosia soli]
MSIQRIHSGPRMSDIVINGNNVHLSGMTAAKREGRSVADQTSDILKRIDELLADAGTSKEHLIQVNIWLSDITTFNEMNEVWDAWVLPGHTPARATVEARLALPDIKVEIQVLAALPG